MNDTISSPNPPSAETSTQQDTSRGPKTDKDCQTTHRDVDLYLGGLADAAALRFSVLAQECDDLLDPSGDGPLPYVSAEDFTKSMEPKYRALDIAKEEALSAHNLRVQHRAGHDYVSERLIVSEVGYM
jgi:hypothetical protein